jgi:hypothetical protein
MIELMEVLLLVQAGKWQCLIYSKSKIKRRSWRRGLWRGRDSLMHSIVKIAVLYHINKEHNSQMGVRHFMGLTVCE